MKKANPRLGTYIRCSTAGENYQAFVPPPLPPQIDLSQLQKTLSEANQALGKLNAILETLPDSDLLLYYYIRKEAVLSSQIEGTQSSLSDLLLYESTGEAVPIRDVVEVSSYVAAFHHGLKRIDEGFPLSLRLIREMHKILLSNDFGKSKQPGQFRSSQNWIGGLRPGNAFFVPPPVSHLMECLDHFEKYLHIKERPYTSLIDAGLIHVQFETIHPFLDGNGRIGRLLIIFFLIMMGDLHKPILYLSLFFKNNRSLYYEKLNAVRTAGDWEGWLKFFLTGFIETSDQVFEISKAISNLYKSDFTKTERLKRARLSAHSVHKLLQKRAITSATYAAKSLSVSVPTARAALNNLKDLNIVKVKLVGKEQFYIYTDLINLLEKGVT